MKTQMKLVLTFGLGFLFSFVAVAQNRSVGSAVGGIIGYPGAPNPGPYSAIQEFENTQTLRDGTHIVHKNQVQLYRDSKGRTRRDHFPFPMRPGESLEPNMIQIFDPVAHVEYFLEPQTHIAHRTVITIPPAPTQGAMMGDTQGRVMAIVPPPLPLPPPPMPSRPVAKGAVFGAASAELQPDMKVEPLGTQLIDGILAVGQRITTTFPVGSQGNDRPMVSVQETWFSQELGMMVLSKHSDPRGENIERLTNISRSEPDASLFQVPSDYTIQDTVNDGAQGYSQPSGSAPAKSSVGVQQ